MMSATKKIKVCQSSIPVTILCSFIFSEVYWMRSHWEIMVPNETGPIGPDFQMKSPSDEEPVATLDAYTDRVRRPDGSIALIVHSEGAAVDSMAASASSSAPGPQLTLTDEAQKAMNLDDACHIVNEGTLQAVDGAKKANRGDSFDSQGNHRSISEKTVPLSMKEGKEVSNQFEEGKEKAFEEKATHDAMEKSSNVKTNKKKTGQKRSFNFFMDS